MCTLHDFLSSKVRFIHRSTVTGSHSCSGKNYAYASRTSYLILIANKLLCLFSMTHFFTSNILIPPSYNIIETGWDVSEFCGGSVKSPQSDTDNKCIWKTFN